MADHIKTPGGQLRDGGAYDIVIAHGPLERTLKGAIVRIFEQDGQVRVEALASEDQKHSPYANDAPRIFLGRTVGFLPEHVLKVRAL